MDTFSLGTRLTLTLSRWTGLSPAVPCPLLLLEIQ